MIKEYLLIDGTLYPMLPDGSEEADLHDSKLWNVYRGNELLGIITTSVFQPVVTEFLKYESMRVYLYDEDSIDDQISDIYTLAAHGEEIVPYVKDESVEKVVTNEMHVQEAAPDQQIMDRAEEQQQLIEEKEFHSAIIESSTKTLPLIEFMRDKDLAVYEITSIFGKTIEEAIAFLKAEGNAVGFDATIGIHEENNQRCIVMHEHDEHRIERERKTEELRVSAISKLSDEEKRALGIDRS